MTTTPTTAPPRGPAPPPDDTGRHPWDRRDGEPARDHARFARWLALHDRRLDRAAKALGISTDQAKRLSRTWAWQDRAAAYDTDQARQVQEVVGRNRLMATAAVTRAIRDAAEGLLEIPAGEVNPTTIYRLAVALKAVTPPPGAVAPAPAPQERTGADLKLGRLLDRVALHPDFADDVDTWLAHPESDGAVVDAVTLYRDVKAYEEQLEREERGETLAQ